MAVSAKTKKKRTIEKNTMAIAGVLSCSSCYAFMIRLLLYWDGNGEDIRSVMMIDGKADTSRGSMTFAVAVSNPAVWSMLGLFTNISARDMTGSSSGKNFGLTNSMPDLANMAIYQVRQLKKKRMDFSRYLYHGSRWLDLWESWVLQIPSCRCEYLDQVPKVVSYVGSQKLATCFDDYIEMDKQDRWKDHQIVHGEKRAIGISLIDGLLSVLSIWRKLWMMPT